MQRPQFLGKVCEWADMGNPRGAVNRRLGHVLILV